MDDLSMQQLTFILLITWVIAGVSTIYCLLSQLCKENTERNQYAVHHHQVIKFNGKTPTYTRHWFTVLFFNIITIGLYSPWGTIRLNQYLYQNITLGKPHFDFIAKPSSIFKGRTIILLFFILAVFASEFLPLIYNALMSIAFLTVMPFLVIKALQFKTRTLSFAGIPCTFKGSLLGAFISFVLGYITIFLTLGLTIPLASKARAHYFINHSFWGDRALSIKLSLKELYKIFLQSLFAFMVIAAPVILFYAFLDRKYDLGENIQMLQSTYLKIVILSLPVIFLTAAIAAKYAYHWCVDRAIYNSLQVKGVGVFQCQFSFLQAFWLAFSNTLVVGITFGLVEPWAKIRVIRFFSQTTSLHTEKKHLSGIKKPTDEAPSALTDEVAPSIFDIDL